MAHPFSNRPTFTGIHDGLFGFGTGAPLGEAEDTVLSEFARSIVLDVTGGTLWSEYAAMQTALVDDIGSQFSDKRAEIYRHLYSTPLTHGFAQGHVVHSSLEQSEAARTHVGSITLDRFYRLAEAVGAVTVKSAEHGQNVILVEGLDRIFERIEDIIGFDLTPPNQAGDLFGLKLSRGLISDRHLDGIYGAWRMKNRFPFANNVIEIGGGTGYLAYYARKMGVRKIAIIDLPQAILAQYIVLGEAFGIERVSINSDVEDGVRLLTTDHALSRNFEGAQVVINVDSFPEMPKQIAFDYIQRIPTGAALLSINQESGVPNGNGTQNVVSALAAEIGLRPISRHPAWLRTGWVEEVFECI